MAKVWKFGADVDTDQIVPGRYAPYMRPGADVGEAAFIEARPEFAQTAQPGDIIVAQENFGCGSSREYAVEALRRRQVGAVIALSFARIFFRNAINLGIPVYVAPDIVQALQDGDQIALDLPGRQIVRGEQVLPLPDLPDFARQVVEAGGIVPYVRLHGHFPGEA
ncbi:MAG: homoaconitate hydratase [Chloroflexi bacterium]|nr:3-isopropylmalate dehydratase [Anaerolineaceae bacterium]NMB88485.1 homoaconitate hydratase [Chloroflexota bacterium]